MRKEYELQTDVLATIVAATPITPEHAELLTAFATRIDYSGARYVMTRDASTVNAPAGYSTPRIVRSPPTITCVSARSSRRMAARCAPCGEGAAVRRARVSFPRKPELGLAERRSAAAPAAEALQQVRRASAEYRLRPRPLLQRSELPGAACRQAGRALKKPA